MSAVRTMPRRALWNSQPSHFARRCSPAVPSRCAPEAPFRGVFGGSNDEHMDVVRTLRTVGSEKELRFWINHYGSGRNSNVAVVKVSSEVLQDEESLDTLCNNLAFLRRVGMQPVLVHGSGIQLSTELAAAGIPYEFERGVRRTSGEALRVARRLFRDHSTLLVNALEATGTRARPMPTSVFQCEAEDVERRGYVGTISGVKLDNILSTVEAGSLPVLCALGETADGQILNVPSDVAARMLAQALQPLKVVYIEQGGGLLNGENELISNINFPDDYDRLIGEPWMQGPEKERGVGMVVREINTLLKSLPPDSSVSITSANDLVKELFTHGGSGTLFRKTDPLETHSSLASANVEQIEKLLQDAFQRELAPGYMESLQSNLSALYLTQSGNATAIVTSVGGADVATPYLCKFAVSAIAQGAGEAEKLWSSLQESHPALFWRSRRNNPVNSWYFRRCDGCWSTDDEWTVFWFGIQDKAEVHACIEAAVQVPKTLGAALARADVE